MFVRFSDSLADSSAAGRGSVATFPRLEITTGALDPAGMKQRVLCYHRAGDGILQATVCYSQHLTNITQLFTQAAR